MYALLHLCACDRGTHERKGAYVHVSADGTEKKHELDRGIPQEREQTTMEKDFPHRVNRASYRPCALKIT